MQQIKKKFKVCYDEKNSPLKLQQFITFEMALMVATYFKAGADPAKGYIFFTKYQNIQRKGNGRLFRRRCVQSVRYLWLPHRSDGGDGG